jgi:hypothetical protein
MSENERFAAIATRGEEIKTNSDICGFVSASSRRCCRTSPSPSIPVSIPTTNTRAD